MLEERGVITRHVALVDQAAVGLPVSVFISIKLERQKEEDLDRSRGPSPPGRKFWSATS